MVSMVRDLERGLVAAGLPPEQASQIADGMDARFAEVATKEDLAVIRRELALRFDALEARMDARFETLMAQLEKMDQKIESKHNEVHHQVNVLERTFWRVSLFLTGVVGALLGTVIYALVG